MARPRSRPALSIAALVTVLIMGGCVFVVDSSSRYRAGPLHDSDALDGIETGKTTRDWVLGNLGQPASSYANDVGNEVLRYVSVKERETEIAVFLLLAVDLEGEEIATLHIEIEGERVKSYWIE